MRVSYNSGYTAPLPEGHVFPMKKFERLHRYLVDTEVVRQEDIVSPGLISKTHLQLMHTSEYVDAVEHGTLTRKQERRMGLPWSRRLALRSRYAVQGTLNAAIMALQDGIAGNLAGGTHHAMEGHGEGFCVYNDVPVAIRVLQQGMWARKILVLDCDVHQGNGTAKLLQDNPEVFTFSLHGEKNYPFRKPPSTLDIGLPDNTGDDEYIKVLEEALETIFGQFEPDLVFYLGGIDPLETDHFGRLNLSLDGLRRRDELVIDFVRQQNKPLTLLLSGGYAPTLDDTVRAHAIMYEAAHRIWV